MKIYCLVIAITNNKRVLERNVTKILSSAKPTKTKTCTLQNCRLISHHPSTSLSQFCSGAKSYKEKLCYQKGI